MSQISARGYVVRDRAFDDAKVTKVLHCDNFAATTSTASMCFKVGASGATAVVIDQTGQVGIGAAVPTALLHVNGTVKFESVPTSDPGVSGQMWNDNGALKLSA